MMNIKEEYIDKTKKYLDDLRKKTDKMKILEDEIEMLEDEVKILKSKPEIIRTGIDFEYELGIKSSPGVKGIDDIIVSTETQICRAKSQIENKRGQIYNIEHEIKKYGIYTRALNDIEREIIEKRYFNKIENSFRDISKKVRYSKSYVAKIHDKAVKDLAYYVYGESAIYE